MPSRLTVVVLGVALTVIAGCGSGGGPAARGRSPVAESDTAAVLAATAVARVAKDNSFGGKDVFTSVDVVERLGLAGGDGTVAVDDEDSPKLTGLERQAVERALAPRTVTWVPALATVTGEGPNVSNPQGHAVLSLAQPVLDGADAQASSELWCGTGCAVGGTHTLHKGADGTWTVTGTTGPQMVA